MNCNELLLLMKKYDLSKEESLAWYLAILFVTLHEQEFPKYPQFRISTTKDPRKSELFKHCYKVLRDRSLPRTEFKQYILAQFHVLKKIKNGDVHACITPNCLSSDQSWKRWLLWKSKLDKSLVYSKATEEPVDVNAVYRSLDETKRFLLSRFSKLTKKDIVDALEGRAIFRWCVLRQVSPYYLALSPTAQEWLSAHPEILESYVIDLKPYRNLPSAVRDYFAANFPWEF